MSTMSNFDPTTNLSLDSLSYAEKLELKEVSQEIKRRLSIKKIFYLYPEEGPYRRELYPKHTEFFEAGSIHRERAFIGANRVGKSTLGSYELAVHATGLYPDWWKGRRFDEPTNWWGAGKTTETTRDIVQNKLFGDLVHEDGRKRCSGTGMLPLKCIGDLTWKPGLPDLVDVAKIKHVSGGWSKVGMKTYAQGRGSFEGTEQHGIWIDEECPMDVYEECMMRTMTTNGLIMLTFTPLEGMSEVVMSYLNIKPEESRV